MTTLPLLAGLIIGLGAVTVIDLHGFLGRKSAYWTEATTRTHKVTKPLIWIGTALTTLGVWLNFQDHELLWPMLGILTALILNGCFLSFSVSPFLLKREAKGHERKLLPKSWQIKITLSFLVSFSGWWGLVLLIASTLNISA